MAGDEFAWAVGIEDTFVGTPRGGTGRVLDEYALIGHYERWREDLDLIASLGVRTVRYGIPWYRVNPEPGVFDWSWTDAVLRHLVEGHGIQPILDLVHYGCPLWLKRSFADPDFPARVAEYAAAVAERYRELRPAYTPLNEPVVNARFCGGAGTWPPYLRGERNYVRLLMAIAEGMSRSTAAIRAADPNAVIVAVDSCDEVVTKDPLLEPMVAWRREAHFLPNELVLGRVTGAHGMDAWLRERGASGPTLEWLVEHPAPFDVAGLNFYPHISCGELVLGKTGVRRRLRHGSAQDLVDAATAWHERFRVPVMITETSDEGARREGWLDDSVGALLDARSTGLPVMGYTWFPVLSYVDWRWRASRRPLSDFVVHMGLWDLGPSLERTPTPLIADFRAHVAAPVGSLPRAISAS